MQNALLGLRLLSQEGQLRLNLCQSSQAWKLIILSLLFRRDVVVVGVEEKVLHMGWCGCRLTSPDTAVSSVDHTT